MLVKVRPIMMLIGGAGASAALGFLIQIFLARALGLEEYGAFSAAFATLNMISPLAGFGVAGFWLSAYGREGRAARRWLPGSIRFLKISTFLTIVIIIMWAALGHHDTATRDIILSMSCLVLGQVAYEVIGAKYQIEGRYAMLSLWQSSQHILRGAGIFVALLIFGRLEAFTAAAVFSLVALFMFIYAAGQVIEMSAGRMKVDLDVPLPSVTSGESAVISSPVLVARKAWPFGLSAIMFIVYYQSAVLIVKYLVGNEAAGAYQVCFVILSVVYLIPNVLYQKFYMPKLHYWAYHDPDKYWAVFRRGSAAMLVMGGLSMLIILFLSEEIVHFLFGSGYESAVEIIEKLALVIPLRFLSFSAGSFMMTRGVVGKKVRIMMSVAVINITLGIIWVSILGVLGAVYATIVSEVILLLLYFRGIKEMKETAPGRIMQREKES